MPNNHPTTSALPNPNPPAPSPAARPPGRPRALDEAKLREICALIAAGCSTSRAANYVGCVTSTIRREARRNPAFCERLRRAHMASELDPLNALRNAAKRHWRAAAWLLERTYTQRYAKRNPRYVPLQTLNALAELVGNVVADEVKDAELRQRIFARVERMTKDAERDILLDHDPVPKPRRQRGRPNVAPPLPAWERPPAAVDNVHQLT